MFLLQIITLGKGVKLQLKVPEVKLGIHLLTWMRSQTEFLTDLTSYAHFLQQGGYGEFTEENLVTYQIYLNQFAKHVFNNVLSADGSMQVSLFRRQEKDKEIFFKLSRAKASGLGAMESSFFSLDFTFFYNDMLKDLQRSESLRLHLL